MIFFILMCHVLFIPFINSSNTTVSKLELTNITLSEPVPHNVKQSNETKVTLQSEGGSLVPGSDDPILALPKDKLTSLDSELGKSKIKPVVARKGVVYIEDDNVKPQHNNISTNIENHTVIPKIQEKSDISTKNITYTTNKSIEIKVNSSILNTSSGAVEDINKTEIHKKPLLLSYDTLANMTVKLSPGTLISDQIQSPNKEKAYAKSANSHPGMIMPVVISILLVPMFAVLGYLALRRGQEAWKNRHYKRMDFLLDGMYND